MPGPLQVLIGVLDLCLNLVRVCRSDREEYARSATYARLAKRINYITLGIVFIITVLNMFISEFDVRSDGALVKNDSVSLSGLCSTHEL